MKSLRIIAVVGFVSVLFSFDKVNPLKGEDLYKTVQKYVSLGQHRTGTETDKATSLWLGNELKSYGYKVKYLEFPIRQFFPGKVYLSSNNVTVKGFPLWWVNESINRNITGTLTDVSSGKELNKNIALIHLPIPGKKSQDASGYLDSLINAGATGIVAITDNPSGEIQEYNTSIEAKPLKVPVILIAPKDSSKLNEFVKTGAAVNLVIDGTFKDVTGRNVYGTIGDGKEYVVVSTPISGWFTCGGERGTGVAIWLALAKWAATQKSKYTIVFTGNSGHEHAFKGAHHFLEQEAPPADQTHLWLHFGAGAATLHYKQTGKGLERENVVDDKRNFYYSTPVGDAFKTAFESVPGNKIEANENPGGELIYVARKGYKRFAGITYAHPFFHVPTDDASTTSPEILESTAFAFKNFLAQELK